MDEGSPPADAQGFHKDVMEEVKRTKYPILRWPGGTFASVYHWEDGIGPKEWRPQLVNYVGGGVETNRFGTDEFIEYCQAVGAEPYITINLGTGALDEILHWLEHCNLNTPTKYASLRKQFGHPEPYHVKYWGIGNDVYGPWQAGHCSAPEYAEKLRQYAQFMKGIDPFIKVIAVGANDPEWDLTVLKHAGHLIYYISIQQYHGSDDYYETVAAAYYVEKRLRFLASLINRLRLNHVKLALDEWNVWHRVSAERKFKERGIVLLEEPYVLKDALFAVGIFLVLHRMCDIVQTANLAQMVNALGMIKTNREAMVLTPIYHVFDLFVNHTGRILLGLEVATEHYAVKAKSFVEGRLSFELDRVPHLDGSATYDSDREMLCLALVNYHREEPAEVSLDLFEAKAARNATLFELSASNPFVGNNFEAPNRVRPMKKSLGLPRFTLSLPPFSLSIAEIPLEVPISRQNSTCYKEGTE